MRTVFYTTLTLLSFVYFNTFSLGACPPGDIDNDCQVGVTDLVIMASQWLNPSGGSADITGENDINLKDFSIVSNSWLQSGHPVVINEFMASNDPSSGISDPQGEYDDWFEVYNTASVPYDIGGLYFTDSLGNPTKWQFPTNVPATSTIPAGGFITIWADNDTSDGPLHANFKLSASGESLGIYDAASQTFIDTYAFSSQITNITTGREPDASPNWTTLIPTPGASNNNSFFGVVANPQFSVDRGFYQTAFNVALSCSTPGSVIHYTTDGSKPTNPPTGTTSVYSSPINVSSTTILQAIAFKAGYQTSTAITHSYIFLADVITQPAQPAGWPTVWHPGFEVNYEMHPLVTSQYAAQMNDALLAIPTMSIVMDQDDLFDQQTGIYSNSQERGVAWERPASVELIYPDGRKGFDINCGIRASGSGSAIPEVNLKHSFRLLFKGIYGPTKLKFKLFEDTDVDEFDTLRLRGGSNFSWVHRMDELEWQREGAQYIRDIWGRDTQAAMNQPASHSTYVHLYFNGLYWGLYNPCERPSAPFMASHLGGEKEDYDALKSKEGVANGKLIDGTRDSWDAMFAIANAGMSSASAYNAMLQYLDVDNLIDYAIIQHYMQNEDWGPWNWYAGRKREPGAGFKFFMWDAEFSMFDEFNNITTWGNDEDNPQSLYQAMRANPEFRIRFGDRVHRHLFNNGVLTPTACINRYTARSNELDLAIIGESARWGDSWMFLNNNQPYMKDSHWIPARDWILNTFLPVRTAIMIGQYRDINLYPNTDAATFNQHGGSVPTNFNLTMSAPAGSIYYTLDGTDPRTPGGGASNDITFVAENATKKVLIPTAINPSNTQWRTDPAYNDTAWNNFTFIGGNDGAIGYENGSGYEDFISYDVNSQMFGINASCYVRIPFSVTSNDLSNINNLILRMKYDDGFIAYINGIQVAQINEPGTLSWNAEADGNHEGDIFEDFNISAHLGNLQVGSNILAIHGLNDSAGGSSDFLISAQLIGSNVVPGGISPSAILYSGPETLTESVHVKSRVLNGPEWSALNEATFDVGPVDTNLRITEIMYHPQDPNAEFIELKNIGLETINLNLAQFTQGINFTFPNFSLVPGAYGLVVRNQSVFTATYPSVNTSLIIGEYTGNLNNGGENIILIDADGNSIHNFNYKDGWYPVTDGYGFSLTKITPDSSNITSWDSRSGWHASTISGGTPGTNDLGSFLSNGSIVINEILAHSDTIPNGDYLELVNTTGSPINIGGWFLSDNNNNLKKYAIPAGTTISGNGFMVFHEDLTFGNSIAPGASTTFAFSENGETAYLTSGDGINFTGTYSTDESFGASEADIAFGRILKSTGAYNFVAASTNTPGSANASAKVGPIVISEIMYHPANNGNAEYIELTNTSGSSITLFDPSTSEPWKITQGIDFTFPTSPMITMAANERILLVKNIAAFNSEYGAPVGTQILQWLNGSLDNSGEKVEISMPGDVNGQNERQYIRIDRINYSDGAHPENFDGITDPWPTGPDGTGPALQRLNLTTYGNDPINWNSSIATPGL